MKYFSLVNETSGIVVAKNVGLANNFGLRLVGLLGKKSLSLDEGLWITSSESVHMIGMRVELDLIFLDKNDVVLKIVKKAQRNKPFFGAKRARSIVELAVGASDLIAVSDKLALV